ncbi:MAG: PEGA domain-containing protein, partial [Candidatus Delongbacteria bacterium]
VLVLIYLIVCPLVLLYSFGYVFQPEEKEISRTGLVHIDTVPAGAHIYLGKSHYKYRTPASITDLQPGEYQISVRLEGYRPWNRRITVRPGKATAFNNIILLPDEIVPVDLFPETRFKDSKDLAGTRYLIVQKGSHLEELNVFDRQREELLPLLAQNGKNSDFATASLFSQKNSALIVVFGGLLWDRKYFSVHLAEKERSLTDITELVTEHPESFKWNDNAPDHIYTIHKDHVNRLNIKTGSVEPKYFDNVKGFGLSDKWLYVLNTENILLRYTPDKKKQSKIFEDERLGKDLFTESQYYSIEELKKQILLFHGDNGDLITTIPPYRISEGNVSGVNYNEKQSILSFWSKTSIWTADHNVKAGDLLFKDRVLVNKVYDDGDNILQCFWVRNATHILFKDADNVYLLEIDPDKDPHKEFIVKVRPGTEISYFEKTGSLYYINSEKKLMKMEIIPG